MATIFIALMVFFVIGLLFGSWLGWRYATWLFAAILAEQHLKLDDSGRIRLDFDNHSLAE